jgi:hypothetical protein
MDGIKSRNLRRARAAKRELVRNGEQQRNLRKRWIAYARKVLTPPPVKKAVPAVPPALQNNNAPLKGPRRR